MKNSELIRNGKVTKPLNSETLKKFWEGKRERTDDTGRGGQINVGQQPPFPTTVRPWIVPSRMIFNISGPFFMST